MKLRSQDERGVMGFVIFIVFFIAYAVITVVYFEIIRVEEPLDDQIGDVPTEQTPSDAPKIPETPLPKGTVLDFSADDKTLVLLTDEDKSLLPENTPSNFVRYMSNTLPSKTEQTNFGCVTAYRITKISNFNISGSIGSVDPKTRKSSDVCTRGLEVVWYLEETNWTWLSENFGSQPFCNDLDKLPIYTEFIAQCVRGSDKVVVANPNGSIKDR